MYKEHDCIYCQPTDYLDSFSKFICPLDICDFYLFTDQRYYGRCVVALKKHCEEIHQLTAEERVMFINDVARVSNAIQTVTGCKKINYTIYGDGNPHLHMHIVPKYEDGPEWGTTFNLLHSGSGYLEPEKEAELIEKLKAAL